MVRSVCCLVLAAVLLWGCAAKSPQSREALREELREALRENPDLVLEVLQENKVAVLQTVEEGARERRVQEQAERLKQALANPLKPAIEADRPMLGAPDAPVTIVGYSDFLCPYCGRAALNIHRLLDRHAGEVRFFFKHLPLHPGSMELAETFEALSVRSDAVAWKFHDLAFASGDRLEAGGEEAITAMLKEIGADPARVARDRKDSRVTARIARDVQEAASFNVDGTPTFLINGVMVEGAVPMEEMEGVMAAALASQKDGTICKECAKKAKKSTERP